MYLAGDIDKPPLFTVGHQATIKVGFKVLEPYWQESILLKVLEPEKYLIFLCRKFRLRPWKAGDHPRCGLAVNKLEVVITLERFGVFMNVWMVG